MNDIDRSSESEVLLATLAEHRATRRSILLISTLVLVVLCAIAGLLIRDEIRSSAADRAAEKVAALAEERETVRALHERYGPDFDLSKLLDDLNARLALPGDHPKELWRLRDVIDRVVRAEHGGE